MKGAVFMKTTIRANDLVKMSDGAKTYIEERVTTLEKLFNNSEHVVANVLCKGYEKYTIVEITIPLKHIILRAESKADTLYAAVDFAVDKVERQLLRHKQKVMSMMKKRDGIGEYFSQMTSGEEENIKPVARTKVIEKEVMSIDEAITQMELSDHDFFAFVNEANYRNAVVYIRKDGSYGVLEMKD